MSAKHSNEEDARLSKLLHEWKPDARLKPRFSETVWRRIAHADAPANVAWWVDRWQLLEAAFRRPALAVSYVAVLLVVGVSAGVLQTREATSRLDHALQARYLQSVDPYQKPR